MPAKPKRYDSLDALRGIAAAVVVLGHCLMTFPVWSDVVLHGRHATLPTVLLGYPPLSLLWAGDAAVKVFFVLSGFVLGLVLLRPQPPGYAAFCAKRVCRIYLPYAAVVAAAMLVMTALSARPAPELSEWFQASWNHPVSGALIRDHALMLGQARLNFVDNPIWSLVHEMRYSLVFPLIMWAVTRADWRKTLAVSLAVSVAAMFALNRAGNFWLIDSAQYAFLFVAGAVIAKHRLECERRIRDLRPAFRMSLLAAAVLLLSGHSVSHAASHAVRQAASIAPHFGAVLLLLLVIGSGQARRMLERKPCLFVGRVSYSLYLSHLVVLLALVHLLHGWLPVWLIVICLPPLALAVAYVLYRFLELPAIALGQRIERRIDSSRRAAPAGIPAGKLVADEVRLAGAE